MVLKHVFGGFCTDLTNFYFGA